MQWARWWCVAPGVQLVDLELLRCHRQPKQRGQEHEPALPGFRTAEVLAEYALLGNGNAACSSELRQLISAQETLLTRLDRSVAGFFQLLSAEHPDLH